MNKKNKKIIIIVTSIIGGLVLTYFGGGLVATAIANNSLFNQRSSTIETLNEDFQRYQKGRADFPLMNEREEVTFKCGKETLQGYFYEVNNPHGLIVTAHGVQNLADGNTAQFQNYFLEQGWNVFSFDLTGCGRSTGDGLKSLFESRKCVRSAVEFVQQYEKTKGLDVCLVGHSWGGYGVLAASYDVEVKAVCSFSGYDKASEMMYGFAETNVSPALVLTKPALDFSISLIQGQDAFFSATSAIKKRTTTSYVLIHGEQDEVVPFKRYSAYAAVEKKDYPNLTKYALKDIKHNGPWKTLESQIYTDEVLEPELLKLHDQYGEIIPEDVYNNFLASVDKEKSSELNYELLDSVNNIFLNSL